MSNENQKIMGKLAADMSHEQNTQSKGLKGIVSNCSIEVADYYTETNSIGVEKYYVKLVFKIKYQADIKEHTVIIPLSALNSNKILKYIPEGCIIAASDIRKQRYITTIINNAIINMKPREKFVLESGYNYIFDQNVFVLGDKIINAPDGYDFVINTPCKLKECSLSRDYFKWINNFFELGTVCPALIISALTSFLQPLFKEAEIKGNTFFSVYIYGESGSFKTETIFLLTGLFANSENVVSLASDKEGICNHSVIKDAFVMIDDLCKTDSRRVKDANEKKLHDIVHQKSGYGAIESKGKNIKIDSTVFITAEYLVKNHSTLNRCLVVEMPQINSDSLTWLQDNQSLYIRFILDFINWVCKNHLRLTDNICNYKELCKNKYEEKFISFEGRKRIIRTELILKITSKVFLQFFQEEFNIMEKDLLQLAESIDNSINYCIADTCESVKKESDELKRDYINVILDIFAYNFDKYVENSYDKYKKANKNSGKDNPQKLFFRDGDCYCIRGKHLEKIYAEINNFPYKFSIKAISAQLKKYDLLESYGGELSFMRRNQDKRKKTDKTRYYHIRVSKIIELFSKEQDFLASSLSPIKELNTSLSIREELSEFENEYDEYYEEEPEIEDDQDEWFDDDESEEDFDEDDQEKCFDDDESEEDFDEDDQEEWFDNDESEEDFDEDEQEE